MKYYEDFQIGDKQVTRARTITETDLVLFSAFTGDWYPLHVDIEFARKSPFGERVAHGFLVLSVASGLMPLYDEAIVAMYGLDQVRFYAPMSSEIVFIFPAVFIKTFSAAMPG